MAGFRRFFGWPALGDKSDPAWVANQQGKGIEGLENKGYRERERREGRLARVVGL